ncbi:MAG: hypothetical protein AB8B97_05680 [Granulosicoccus sp.]
MALLTNVAQTVTIARQGIRSPSEVSPLLHNSKSGFRTNTMDDGAEQSSALLARRRPSKALRQAGSQKGNLKVFDSALPSAESAKQPSQTVTGEFVEYLALDDHNELNEKLSPEEHGALDRPVAAPEQAVTLSEPDEVGKIRTLAQPSSLVEIPTLFKHDSQDKQPVVGKSPTAKAILTPDKPLTADKTPAPGKPLAADEILALDKPLSADEILALDKPLNADEILARDKSLSEDDLSWLGDYDVKDSSQTTPDANKIRPTARFDDGHDYYPAPEASVHERSVANNDADETAATGVYNRVSSRYRLAIAATGCLWIAALTGYVWSLSINSEQKEPSQKTNRAVAQTVAPSTIATQSDERIVSQTLQPSSKAKPIAAATTSDASTNEWVNKEEEYLEEIMWLSNQNKTLQREVHALNEESANLNSEVLQLDNELLQLELDVVSMKFKLEQTTEKRVVYNFVDVPISGQQPTSSSNPGSLANAGRSAQSRTLPGTNDRLGVPRDNQISDQRFMESEEDYTGPDNDYPYAQDGSSYEQDGNSYAQDGSSYVQDGNSYMQDGPSYVQDGYSYSQDGSLYAPNDDSYAADRYVEEAFLEDQEMLEYYNGGEPPNSEIGYDPETGFYINEQYINYETQYEVDGINAN